MTQRSPILIPSVIQRVRCFMNTDGRFKVAGVGETLDAFSLLLARQADQTEF